MQPKNVNGATVLGAEFEVRKSLGLISPGLENLNFSSNVSLIYSVVDKDEDGLAILRAEQATGKRQNINDSRPFQGQSPYIINVGLSYINDPWLWENALSFNVFGERLAFQSGALDPDVYERSRPSLNFVSNKQFEEKLSVKLKVTNILNSDFLKEYDFNGQPTYESFQLGTTFSVGLNYKM